MMTRSFELPPLQLGDFSDVAPMGNGPGGDGLALDDGNEAWTDTSERQLIADASVLQGRVGVFVTAGQSHGSNLPATNPYWQSSRYTPHGDVIQLNPFDGKFYKATDPLLGTSGVGGNMWTRMADRIIDDDTYDKVVLLDLNVGGSFIQQWTSAGVYFRKLMLGFRMLQEKGLTPTAMLWQHGIADAQSAPDYYVAQFQSIVGTLRQHGMTAPIYVGVNSGDPLSASGFAVMQQLLGSSRPDLSTHGGLNLDSLPRNMWAPDGHLTTAGLDAGAAIWSSILRGLPTVTPGADALISRSDLSGDTAYGIISGLTIEPHGVPTFGAEWKLLGAADFDGDGHANDLLFRPNADGAPAAAQIQLLDAVGNPSGGGCVAGSPFDSAWRIVGFGDFNHDGTDDIVVQDGAAHAQVQLLARNVGIGGGAPSYSPYDAGWNVIGTAETEIAGRTDLLWRGPRGDLQIQFLDGLTHLGGGVLSANSFGADWTLVGAGDFRGTGRLSDLVWEHDGDHQVQVQFLDGAHVAGGGAIQNNPFDATWRVTGIEARDTLIWQRSGDGALDRIGVTWNATAGGGALAVDTTDTNLAGMFGNHNWLGG